MTRVREQASLEGQKNRIHHFLKALDSIATVLEKEYPVVSPQKVLKMPHWQAAIEVAATR